MTEAEKLNQQLNPELLAQERSVFDPSSDLYLGYVLNEKYELSELLGSGGWGNVYRGKHLALGIDIAVKVMHKHLAGDSNHLKRFTNEAVHLSQLNNKHIVRIMDYGVEPIPYIVMDYCAGTPLDQWLGKNGSMSFPIAIQLFIQVCDALANARELGLVHRDLKPSNILLAIDEEKNLDCKVLDFGIAKTIESENEDDRLTTTGYILGSPPYMPPEQWSGKTDHRSDIYSLGCIMYEVISGRAAFKAFSRLEYIEQHISTTPAAILSIAPDVKFPRALETVISKCIQKNPENRYRAVEDLAADLQLIAAGKSPKISFISSLGMASNKNLGKLRIILLSSVFLTLVILAFVLKPESAPQPPGILWQQLDLQGQKKFDRGDLIQAEVCFNRSLNQAKKAGERKLIEASLNELLDIYRARKNRKLENDTVKELQKHSIGTSEIGQNKLITSLDAANSQWKNKQSDVSNISKIKQLCDDANDTAAILIEGGELLPAKSLCEKALQLASSTLDQGDLAIIRAAHNLAFVNFELGNTNEAISKYSLSLSISRKISRAPDLAFLHNMIGLADAYMQAKNYEETRNVLNDALDVSRKSFGSASKETAECKLHLATLEWYQGHEDRARSNIDSAMAIYKNVANSNPASVSPTDLAAFYLADGEINGDVRSTQSALDLLENTSTKQYPQLCRALLQLAKQSRAVSSGLKQSEAYLMRASSILQRFDAGTGKQLNAEIEAIKSIKSI